MIYETLGTKEGHFGDTGMCTFTTKFPSVVDSSAQTLESWEYWEISLLGATHWSTDQTRKRREAFIDPYADIQIP